MRVTYLVLLLAAAAFPRNAQASEPLPRVLIIGDGVYQEPARAAAKELKGRVDVVFSSIAAGEVRNTETALKNLNALLGEGKWDLIHFNFGLGDLVYRAPGLKAFRVMTKNTGGVRAVDARRYGENLRQLVPKLKATGARLIWASTTPIRSSPNGIFDQGSEKQYNEIAAAVMKVHQVPINDMYAYATSVMNMKRPAWFDPFTFDRKPLHPPIVATIKRLLNL